VGAGALLPEEQLGQYAVDGHTPKAVVMPDDVEGLSKVVAFAAQEKLSVTPWGGGTRMVQGNPPTRVDIIVKTTNINKVTEHYESDFTLGIGGGATLTSVRDYLAQKGQYLPLDAPLPDEATIGGILATNTTTPRQLMYNLPRDFVLGMKVVQSDGAITGFGGRVMKNVSGYDIGKLYIGSWGTLGIIVEATLRLLPMPKAGETLVASYGTVADALNAGKAVVSMNFTPQSVEVVTGEALNILPTGVVKNDATAALLVSVSGWPSAVTRMTEECSKLLSGAQGLERITDDSALWQSVTDLGWMKDGGANVALRASVLPSKLEEAIAALDALAVNGSRSGMVVGPGYGGLRSLVWAGADSPDSVREYTATVRSEIEKLGGYMFMESCPLEAKEGIDAWGEVPGGLGVMKRVKAELDPDGIFNPGRFVEDI
jgi:glycolate oxidase FAD binding subunit